MEPFRDRDAAGDWRWASSVPPPTTAGGPRSVGGGTVAAAGNLGRPGDRWAPDERTGGGGGKGPGSAWSPARWTWLSDVG